MKNSLSFLSLFLILIASSQLLASPTNQPLSFSNKLTIEPDSKLAFPSLDMQKINQEDLLRDRRVSPYRFAISHNETEATEFEKNGVWQTAGETSIWRLPVSAAGAYSLSFGFDNVFLPNGAKLFIYDQNQQQVLGPYTDKDNKSHKELWTPTINSDTAFIEINIPTKLKPYLKFNLKTVNHGYRSNKAADGSKSGSCNIDVVCSQGDAWRDEIRSVASYNFTTPGGSFVCTGSLVNNTSGDLKPYFLTANHCVSTAAAANSMVFFWNFETTTCDGTPNGPRNQSQSGATLRASWGGGSGGISLGDMTLVELDTTPDAAFNVYYAGWDATDIAPSSAVAIHHPAGDEKRISFDTDPLTITNYLADTPSANARFLRVGAWNEGTTEGGSSGSGIWNDQRRIVGTLSGGFASCDAPNDPDWYGRVSEQWEGGGTAATQLKAWLDPADTGVITLDGSNVCVAPASSFTVNPNPAEVNQVITFTSTVTGGVPSDYTYAWDFDDDGVTDSTDASPSFTYTSVYIGNVNLTVTNRDGCSTDNTAALVVEHQGGNIAPVASVAQNTISVDENDAVQLDASTSTDANNDSLDFSWTQTAGTTANLSNATSSIASFTAPQVSADETLSFEVTVTDIFNAESKSSVTVNVANVNQAPTASVAQGSITVNEGGTVTLDAGTSSDPDGDTLTYSWAQTAGATVTLTNATSASATFTAPQVTAATSFSFEVTVSDPAGEESKASVNVTVNDVPPPPPPSSGGGGSFGWFFLLLLSIALLKKNANQFTVLVKEDK